MSKLNLSELITILLNRKEGDKEFMLYQYAKKFSNMDAKFYWEEFLKSKEKAQ